MLRDRSLKRRLLFPLLLVLLIAGVMEMFSYAVLVLIRSQEPQLFAQDWDGYVDAITDAYFDRFYGGYHDPVLGWDNPAGHTAARDDTGRGGWQFRIDETTARYNDRFAGQRPYIATYGDSFTFGDEVSDHATWQYVLSRRLNRYVANFGVSGFGTDQAYVKFRDQHAGNPAPAIAVLGIHEENIARIVNRYRPFYAPNSTFRLGFKPIFVADGDALALIANPLGEPVRDRDRLTAMVHAAKERDGWVSLKISLAPPYSYRVLRLAVLVVDRATGYAPPLFDVDYPSWRDNRTTALMRRIVEAFAATARERGIVPVVLFFPEIRTSWRDPDAVRDATYRPFVQWLRRSPAMHDTVVVDIAEASFDAEAMNVGPFEGHFSAYGNEVVADQLLQALVERRLVPGGVQATLK